MRAELDLYAAKYAPKLGNISELLDKVRKLRILISLL